MKKENWLAPVTKEDVFAFARDVMKIGTFTNVEELEDLSYGKFFKVEGFKKEDALSQWGSPAKHVSLNLGEFGPVDADPYLETTVDDLRQLFGGDQELINIYLSWVMFVAEKNAGKTINGQNYNESFSNACNSHIDLVKSAEIRTIESEAAEKKKCVSSFVSQLAPKQSAEENGNQKQ